MEYAHETNLQKKLCRYRILCSIPQVGTCTWTLPEHVFSFVTASCTAAYYTCRSELEEQRARHAALVEEERQSHSKELAALGRRLAGEREELAASLGERHQKDKEEMQMANQMAVETMRKSLLLQGQQQVGQVEREYSMKMADLQVDLTAGHEREKRSLRAECEAEIQKHREQTERLLAERRNEVSA